MTPASAFDEYLATLGRLTAHIDPTASTSDAEDIRMATRSLAGLGNVDESTIVAWVATHPNLVPVLGLVVGLSQERLKNVLKDGFGTSGWTTLAREKPVELVRWFDASFDLLRLLTVQRNKTYEFADVLVARAGTRVTATQAGKSGRKVEDELEAIARDLGLPYSTRTRFIGRNGQDAPCDLVIPGNGDAQIVVAAKGFDSTGSKLSDAVREIQEMANVRRPTQFVLAVIDGIGWKSRVSDLRKIHALWSTGDIDGMYTLATLDKFRDDLAKAARLRGLLH
ncbi:hypothetical protein [Curtobacterium flaccumfaciens]|uniref:hypothetical protein n=1 Tax=Curtobacterium flaccumfaciens TaxID=2035 RepID=UPI001AD9FA00|nr:hypothetical protein [Curtobacterium flaccumfaciens]MBO9049171.1 hypothetical protein [Curtobacterium flaccumfaciens pv. flaccumfaciens]